MEICTLWVRDAWDRTWIRADHIVTVRVVAQHSSNGTAEPWRLEVITTLPLGENGSHVIPLCVGSHEDFHDFAPRRLLSLLTEHLDSSGYIHVLDEHVGPMGLTNVSMVDAATPTLGSPETVLVPCVP